MLSSACWTGRSQCLESSSSIMLRKSGDRCCTTTNAIPDFVGTLAKNCSSDSRPPAEAPIPTTRNLEGLRSDLEKETVDVSTASALPKSISDRHRRRTCKYLSKIG